MSHPHVLLLFVPHIPWTVFVYIFFLLFSSSAVVATNIFRTGALRDRLGVTRQKRGSQQLAEGRILCVRFRRKETERQSGGGKRPVSECMQAGQVNRPAGDVPPGIAPRGPCDPWKRYGCNNIVIAAIIL